MTVFLSTVPAYIIFSFLSLSMLTNGKNPTLFFGFLETEDFDYICLQGNMTEGLNWTKFPSILRGCSLCRNPMFGS